MEQHSSNPSTVPAVLVPACPSCQPTPPPPSCRVIYMRVTSPTFLTGPNVLSRMSRPTEDEPLAPGACPACPSGADLAWPHHALSYLSTVSVSRSTAPLSASHCAGGSPTWVGPSTGTREKRKWSFYLLAFRHKPPPAMARSENWLPRSRLAGGMMDGVGAIGGAGLLVRNHTSGQTPTRVSPARIKRLLPGGYPPPIHHLSHFRPSILGCLFPTSSNNTQNVAKARGLRLMENGAKSPRASNQ